MTKSQKSQKIIADIIIGCMYTGGSLIGWNNLGAADALGAPHLSLFPMLGVEWFAAGVAYTVARAAAAGIKAYNNLNG